MLLGMLIRKRRTVCMQNSDCGPVWKCLCLLFFIMPSHDHCCVPLCVNRRNKWPDLSYHVFPRRDDVRSQWIAAVHRDEGPNFRVTVNTVACSEHFLPEDFVGLCMLKDSKGTSECKRPFRRLKPAAVPSVFAFHPAKFRPRPSPADRRMVADRHVVCKRELASLSVFGPETLADVHRKHVEQSRRNQEELESVVAHLKAENALLRL